MKTMTMTESRIRDKNITRMMITIHLLITAALGLIFTVLFRNMVMGFTIGVIAWTLVLFKTPVFDWTFINVRPNWAVILGNQFKYDKISDDPNSQVKMLELVSMREIGSGIRGKMPWEVPFQSFDLGREIIIGRGQKLQCYTSNNIPLEIEWQATLTPLQGFLDRLARNSDDTTTAFFEGECKQFIIGWIKGNSENDMFGSLDESGKGKGQLELEEQFKNLFGGENVVDETERNWGIFTNRPQIIRITRSQRYQEAAEGVEIGKKISAISEEIHRQFIGKKPDPNMVLAAAAAASGNQINGLLLIPGLSDKTAGVVMGAAGKLGAQITGQKTKTKEN